MSKEYLSTVHIEQIRQGMECAGWLDCEINDALANVVPIKLTEGLYEAHLALQHADAGNGPAYGLWMERMRVKWQRRFDVRMETMRVSALADIEQMFARLRTELASR